MSQEGIVARKAVYLWPRIRTVVAEPLIILCGTSRVSAFPELTISAWQEGVLEAAVAVKSAEHGDFDAHVEESHDAVGPVAFDGGAALVGQAEFGEEDDGGIEVFDDDADVVHSFEGHDVSSLWNLYDSVVGVGATSDAPVAASVAVYVIREVIP